MPEDSAKSGWWRAPGTRQVMRAAFAAMPVGLVNITAFIGQFAFLDQHVPWILPGKVLIAVAIELIAVYLAWHAHLATMSNDSSGRLKAGAHFCAQVVGAMNYSHYAAPHWRPTVMAVLMYGASALSPWLWGVHTRRASRDKLMERNLVEEHSVRLGATRWMWHAFRSARVTYWATWHGVNDPQRAIGHFAPRYGTADEPAAPRGSLQLARRRNAASDPAPFSEPAAPAPETAPAAPVPQSAPASLPWPVARGPERASVGAEPWSAPDRPGYVPDSAPLVRGPGGSPQAWLLPATDAEGDDVGGSAEVEAAVALQAEPSISSGYAKPPSAEVIADVELRLAGMQLWDLPSERRVALMLSTTTNQRRLAKKLLEQRRQAADAQPPAREAGTGNGAPYQGTAPGMIAPPQGFQPGGNGTHG